MSKSFRVVARLKAKTGKEAELKKLLSDLIIPTQKEKGSIHYELLENREDPTEFTFVEEWSDDEAVQGHLEALHVQNAIKRFPDMVAGDMDLRTYNLVGGR